MATYYISPSGSDLTGTGSSGNPWKTLDKAFTQNAALARGDTIFMADGTYIENSSGAGYWNITRTPSGSAGYVTIQPTNGASGNVIISGTAGTGLYDAVLGITSWIRFNFLKFASANNAKSSIMRVNGACSNIIFTSCTYTITTHASITNFAVSCTATTAISNITWDAVTITCVGTDNCRGISFIPTGLAAFSGISIVNSSISVVGHNIVLQGVLNITVANNNLYSSGISGGYGIWIGYDNFTPGTDTNGNPFNSSGIVFNNHVESVSGHTVIVGAGSSGVQLGGNRVWGGYSLTAGQGLVLKNCTGTEVFGNIIYDGLNSGLYFKASINCKAYYNTLINRFIEGTTQTSSCIRLGVNTENNSKASGNMIRYNKCVVSAKQALYWEGSSGDDGTNVIDNNEYSFTDPSYNWGTVNGQSVLGQNIASLKSAWASSNRPSNEQKSGMLGQITNVYSMHATGRAVYAMIFDVNGRAWNGKAFEPFTPLATNIGKYAFHFYEHISGNGFYQSLSLHGLPNGLYTLMIKEIGISGVAMVSDSIFDTQKILWSGSKIPTSGVVYQSNFVGV